MFICLNIVTINVKLTTKIVIFLIFNDINF